MLGSTPPDSRKIASLKNGFWEETAIHRGSDGETVVRKSVHASPEGTASPPWAVETLRREIVYLKELPPRARKLFPPVLQSWGTAPHQPQSPGYEMPFYADRIHVAHLLGQTRVPRREAEAFQTALARRLFDDLHADADTAPPSGMAPPASTSAPESAHPSASPLSLHVHETLRETTRRLAENETFRPLVDAASLTINGRQHPGLQRALTLLEADAPWSRLDSMPAVRLHGDLILENILCRRDDPRWWKDFLLIDPVSVAGVHIGTPLFDLVKYESYASGELPAIRSELCIAGTDGPRSYHFAWDHRHPDLAPYAGGVWHCRYREGYTDRWGAPDQDLIHLLEAYFSLVMAINTAGRQQWARVLKGLLALDLILAQ